MLTAYTFGRPTPRAVQLLRAQGRAVYAFEYDYAPEFVRYGKYAKRGAYHTIDMPFVFHNFPFAPITPINLDNSPRGRLGSTSVDLVKANEAQLLAVTGPKEKQTLRFLFISHYIKQRLKSNAEFTSQDCQMMRTLNDYITGFLYGTKAHHVAA